MKLHAFVLVAGLAVLAVPASATLLYSFETGLQGWAPINSGAVNLTQSTIGATEGTHSMQVNWSGGFQWYGDATNNFAVRDALVNDPNKEILFDVTVPDGGLAGWSNALLAMNDSLGWRQVDNSKQLDIPQTAGTYTLAFDISGITGPNPTGTWFQLFFSVNGPTTETYYIDNIRTAPVPEPASLTVLVAGAGLLIRRRRSR